MQLLTTQKNNVLNFIKKIGLEPFNFKWNVIKSKHTEALEVSQLRYRDSLYFFNFDFAKGETYWVTYSPGRDRSIERKYLSEEWEDTMIVVKVWLRALRQEIEEPDLWERISDYTPLNGTTPTDDTSNLQFTNIEVERIVESIQQVRQYIETHYNENKDIEEKLDYLIDSSKRMGRRDWFNICIGTLLTLGIQYGIEKEHLQQIWKLIKEGLTGVIHFLP